MRWRLFLAAPSVLVPVGCSSSSPSSLPVTTLHPTSTTTAASTVALSEPCKAAFLQGHNDEAAGMDTFVAFRPSVQACANQAEWAAAASAQGVNLGPDTPVFLDRTCNAADDKTKALPICHEVKGADN